MSQQMIALLIFLLQHYPGQFVDADGDGYRNLADCNDADATTNPGASESCRDQSDNDCDGVVNDGCGGPTDADGDGWNSIEDCDDSDAQVHIGAQETCGDGIDSNCNAVDCQ